MHIGYAWWVKLMYVYGVINALLVLCRLLQTSGTLKANIFKSQIVRNNR
jgi:hypothetical protein